MKSPIPQTSSVNGTSVKDQSSRLASLTLAATPSLSRISDPNIYPIASSYPKGTSTPFLTRSSAVLPMNLKPEVRSQTLADTSKHGRGSPVKHSTNLKPSAAAIASTIFELTVDATMAMRSAAYYRKTFQNASYRTRTKGLSRSLIPLQNEAGKQSTELISRKCDPLPIGP